MASSHGPEGAGRDGESISNNPWVLPGDLMRKPRREYSQDPRRVEAARIATAAFEAEGIPGNVGDVRTIAEVHEDGIREPLVWDLEIAEDDWIVYWDVDRGPYLMIGPSTIAVVSSSGELRYIGSAGDEG